MLQCLAVAVSCSVLQCVPSIYSVSPIINRKLVWCVAVRRVSEVWSPLSNSVSQILYRVDGIPRFFLYFFFSFFVSFSGLESQSFKVHKKEWKQGTQKGVNPTTESSMQAQGLSHHLMHRALSHEEGERGKYVYVYAYLHVWYVT